MTIFCNAQSYYKCFQADKNKKIELSVFYQNETPKYIQFVNSKHTVSLRYKKNAESFIDGYATFSETYYGIMNGKSIGVFIFTHSGNWDYIEHIDGKKKSNYTINNESSIDGGFFRDTPCF
jgi:hypothetical protein